MGDELRGENLVHLNVRFSTETELKKIQDFLYEKSGQGVSFTGLVEAMANEVTIVTAVHNIKSNKGSRTAGVDKMKMDKYLQMPKDELILLIQSSFRNYRPKPARREYIEKSNGKKRPLGIPTVLDRIIQECVRIIIEPICEARFYPQSYGFRPYRAQKHAIRGIINVINAGCKSPDQPVWAIEGDIKGCFDNINHRLLLQKLWRIGIHDKRVLKLISQMLKAGYMENDLFHVTELGTPQGGILSPLLSNVYLNDFDWYVGRMYMEPHRQCKHKGNDTRRLKWAGVTPKYNYRYADDWVILTSTEKEALRLKCVLTKYFRNRMKLELSQEKTYVTDLRTNGICKHQLGRRNLTPEQKKFLIGKQYHSEKSTRGGNHGNQYTQVANCQIDNLPPVENTTERIAKENNVSPSFVIRAEQFMKTVELMEKYCPGIQEEILSGKLKLSQREATIIRGTPTEALPTVVSTWREEKLNGKPDDSADTYENSELLSKVTENNFSTAAISKIQTPDPLSENRPFISSGRRSTELQTIREPGEKMATVDSILEIGNAVSSTNNENQQDAVDTALAA